LEAQNGPWRVAAAGIQLQLLQQRIARQDTKRVSGLQRIKVATGGTKLASHLLQPPVTTRGAGHGSIQSQNNTRTREAQSIWASKTSQLAYTYPPRICRSPSPNGQQLDSSPCPSWITNRLWDQGFIYPDVMTCSCPKPRAVGKRHTAGSREGPCSSCPETRKGRALWAPHMSWRTGAPLGYTLVASDESPLGRRLRRALGNFKNSNAHFTSSREDIICQPCTVPGESHGTVRKLCSR